jgi:hypothetical protein
VFATCQHFFWGSILPRDLPTSTEQSCYYYPNQGHFLWWVRCATVSLRSADNTKKAGTSSKASDLYSCIRLQSQLRFQTYWHFMQFSLVIPANVITPYIRPRGSTVVKVLRYKSEGRWFDPRWCHGIFHWHKSFWSHYAPGVDSASNRNEYQYYSLEVNAAGA